MWNNRLQNEEFHLQFSKSFFSCWFIQHDCSFLSSFLLVWDWLVAVESCKKQNCDRHSNLRKGFRYHFVGAKKEFCRSLDADSLVYWLAVSQTIASDLEQARWTFRNCMVKALAFLVRFFAITKYSLRYSSSKLKSDSLHWSEKWAENCKFTNTRRTAISKPSPPFGHS